MSCEGEFLVVLTGMAPDGPMKVRIERADPDIHATDRVMHLTREGSTVCTLTGGTGDDFTGAMLTVKDGFGRAAAYHCTGRCAHGHWRLLDTLTRCPN